MTEYVIASDEVGTGAWSGPFFVCAVATPKSWVPPVGLNDSKKLTTAERLALYPLLLTLPLALVSVSNEYIDSVGLHVMLLRAHTLACQVLLRQFPGADIVVDGNLVLPELPQARSIPKADALVPACSAASVVAKVNRDYVMHQHHLQFPRYGWDTNVGYRSKKHEEGLDRWGVTPLHRRSYRNIKKLLERA